jgi:2-oxoglutarate dehydrogenase E2 component (dihydrolipoamide succinyltransferase)
MLVDIIMPKMGESIMEGTILKWLKKAGDKIERDEPILEISTDKVDTEVPAPESGVLAELLFKEGDTIEVGKVIARMNTDANAEVSSEPVTEEPKEVVAEVKEEKPAAAPVVKASEEEKTEGGGFYSPLVLSIAKKEGISFSELESINGTGANSRVTKKDILDYVKNRTSQPAKIVQPAKAVAPAPAVKKPVELLKQEFNFNEEGLSILEFDNVRQKMAEHMVASVGISPHVNSIAEVDMSTVEKVRQSMMADFEEKEGIKLTYMPFICDSVIKALKDFPLINSVIDDSSVPFKAISRSKRSRRKKPRRTCTLHQRPRQARKDKETHA